MTNPLIQSVEQTYKDGLEILKKKNADYAGDADPYKNFRFSSLIGVGVEEAILVRVTDKIARISNILHKDAQVKDETITDTLVDAINYLAILKAYLENNSQHK